MKKVCVCREKFQLHPSFLILSISSI
ncbi:DUF3709 domain-containing protein [Pediococcus sp.]